jgi:hypothetical protein
MKMLSEDGRVVGSITHTPYKYRASVTFPSGRTLKAIRSNETGAKLWVNRQIRLYEQASTKQGEFWTPDVELTSASLREMLGELRGLIQRHMQQLNHILTVRQHTCDEKATFAMLFNARRELDDN